MPRFSFKASNPISSAVASDTTQNESRPLPRQEKVSVGVLTTLEWGPRAGGHVKCWERFAEAAAGFPEIDLTLHFLGDREEVIPLSDNVRIHLLPPVFSTRRLPFLGEGPGHTDLSPFHPRLARLLHRYNVIQITDVFSFANTARWHCRTKKTPLVKSIHTHVDRFTRVYSAETFSRLSLRIPVLERLLLGCLKLDERAATGMRNRVRRFVAKSDLTLVTDSADREWISALGLQVPVRFLRRGIDKHQFHPMRRNRNRLGEWGIKPDRIILLFAGRVDDSKRVMTAAESVRYVLDRGYPVHFIVAGEGARKEDIKSLLGDDVTLTGSLPQSSLNWLYASADLFIFPSLSETFGNVMLEACASGCPILAHRGGTGEQFVTRPGVNGFLVEGSETRDWALALEALVDNPRHLDSASKAIAADIHCHWPTWGNVVGEDLVPVWKELAKNKEIKTEIPVSSSVASRDKVLGF